MITADLIRILNPRHPNPNAAADALQQAAVRFGLTHPESLAAWLANLSVESGFLPVRENMFYTNAARARTIFSQLRGHPDSAFIRNPQGMANIVYAGRLGNGSAASGDGWRYRGGGMIQTTGRNGYRKTGELIGLDLEAHPELLEQYGPAALAAAAYWTRLSSADRLARAGDIRGTRRAVNGPAMLHADEMMAAYQRILPLIRPAPRLLLVPKGGGEPGEWNGRDNPYGGVTLSDALSEQLRTVYPPGSGPHEYQGLRIWHRRNGDLVLERRPLK
ncbi:glycoside hydrolase family 19 protein [Deinococcus daejeonensis]|uniref:Glycoside hydrolase family 19 n=1 Tax=Deinococcus daejeonensis TaxID=1007098 RepID=A0ABQ2IYV3_9DEIO|nr:hypothetical protein [Deinococcus daejeonensis]GGN32208.1 hypothetical protein GCM10010842_08670 [Deinococcus daejeonensis]